MIIRRMNMNALKSNNWKIVSILVLAILVFPLAHCDEKPKPPPPTPDNLCTCTQYDLVCTEGVSTCWDVECQHSDYKDGKCFLYSPGTIPQIPEPLRGPAAKTLDLYFTAYADAVKAGGGPPNKEAIEKAKKSDPDDIIAIVLLGMTNDFLYIAMGNDFKALTLDGPWGACEVGAVKDKTQTLALVEAVKKGTVEAIERNSAAAVAGSIKEFFKTYPEYRPVYPGACYSEKIKQTPSECITGALEQRLSLLTGS